MSKRYTNLTFTRNEVKYLKQALWRDCLAHKGTGYEARALRGIHDQITAAYERWDADASEVSRRELARRKGQLNMSTVGRMIFRTILHNNGRFEDDQIPVSLWTYRNRAGVLAYKICWHEGTVFGFLRTDHCSHRVLMWTKRDGHTKEGLAFLRGEDPVDDEVDDDDHGTIIMDIGE